MLPGSANFATRCPGLPSPVSSPRGLCSATASVVLRSGGVVVEMGAEVVRFGHGFLLDAGTKRPRLIDRGSTCAVNIAIARGTGSKRRCEFAIGDGSDSLVSVQDYFRRLHRLDSRF